MLKKIKVMHVVRPADGGIKNHLLALVGKSHGDRFHHLVACPPGSLADSLEGMGIEAFRVPLRGEVSPGWDLAVIKMLVSLLKRTGADVLHAHSSKAGLVGRVAAGLAGVPAIMLTVHNSVFQKQRPRWQEEFLALSERALSGFTGRIIVVSGALGREITDREKINPGKIVTIYNGVVPDQFNCGPDRDYLPKTTGIPPGKRVVGTVARLAPQKGVGDFIRAAARVAEKSSDAVFLAVGDGPLRAELEQTARSLNLGGKFFFAGERGDIERIMPCLDVFVLASSTEGLPLTVLEALAARCPVAATRVGGIPEVITNGVHGLLVEPGDIHGLAGAILSLLGDREKSRAMGETGRELVLRKFTVEEMVSSTERVYIELLCRGGV